MLRGRTAGSSPSWVENKPTAGARANRLDELWAHRELVAFLALRDVKVRYKQAAFGFAWAIVQPLAGAIALTLVFRRLVGVPSDGAPYAAFAFVGFLAWTYFSTTLGGVTRSLVDNASLITKVYFPRLSAPLATLLPALIELAIGLAVLLVGLVVTGRGIPLAVLTLPVWIIALVVSVVGPGLLLATLNVSYRDAHHGFGLLMQLWLFASPVAYPASLIRGAWRYVYALNPMSTAITGLRWATLGTPAPGREGLVSLAVAALLLLAGLRYFRRAERRFADVI